MAIGEAGSVTTNSPTENQPITVNLTDPLTDPVFALTATNNGGNQFVLRITGQTLDGNGDTIAFTFIIEEWEYHDGPHGATETINWLAVEEGVHTLPDGRIIEAGTSSISSTANNTGGSETFSAGFTSAPVVLTSVMSENETTTVDADPSNITASGFDLTLQEEEAEDRVHAAETIGWIAIEAGGDGTSGTAATHTNFDENVDIIDLGASFTNGIVLGETQTINGGDTATVVIDSQTSTTVGLFLEEEQSLNNEMNHVDETVGVVAFEDGLILCFAPDARIATPFGAKRACDLRQGDLVLTQDNGPQPLRWSSRRHLQSHELSDPQTAPVCLTKDSIAPGMPARDLWVSPQHRILIQGWRAQLNFGLPEALVPAKSLAKPGTSLHRPNSYVHLLFDRHEIVVAEGLPSESLFPPSLGLTLMDDAARASLLENCPDLRTGTAAFRLARPSIPARQARVLRAA